ncbi:MAG TPA: hypothetical protein VGI74_22210, partial [Streptosporangiaceae bacterium]
MSTEWSVGTGGLTRRGPAVMAAVVAVALAGLAGGGRAAGATADVISTAAGGVGGPGSGMSVALGNPCDVSVGNGHIFIADTKFHTFDRQYSGAVREMSPSSSELTTVAGNGEFEKYANGGVATDSYLPTCGTVVGKSGNLIVTDYKDERIRVVAAVTGTFYGQAMTAGHIYAIAGNGQRGFAGDGGPATQAKLFSPSGVTVDAAGNVLFSDEGSQRVRVVAETSGTFYGQAMTAGDIYSIAGDGRRGYSGDFGLGTKAELHDPAEVAVDPAGNVLIADFGNSRIRVVARTAGTFYGMPMKAGFIYTVAGNGVSRYSGDGALATSAGLDPDAVTVDASGNMIIGDAENFRVRVVAAVTGTFYGQAMTAGDIYTIAGDGNNSFRGDGGPATQAEFRLSRGVAVDSDGNVILADAGNFRVRVVAAVTGTFYGKKMTAGNMYTIAGTGNAGKLSGVHGPAASAELENPRSTAVDAAGNVLFLDGNKVQAVAKTGGTFYGQQMAAGDLYNVAGSGTRGFSGDGGPAVKAEMSPGSLTVDAAGNLVIADGGNNRVR